MRNHPRVIPITARDLLPNGRVIALCALVAAFSLGAQAQEPVPLARGNTPGEPHHHLKIENEYVRVYYVEVPPHENTQLHQHDHDYLFITLGDSDVINAVRDKPEVHLILKDGETHFTRGGFAHVARNQADTPFRNVTIELLKLQGEVRNLCEKVVQGELGACQAVENPSMSGKPYFQSAEVEVFRGSLKSKVRYGDVGKFDRLLVAMDQTELEVTSPSQPPTRLSSGGVLWLPANRMQTIANLRTEPSSYLTILFKDSGQQEK